MSDKVERNEAWCREHPAQAAQDIFRLQMAVDEAHRLLREGNADEAKVWLFNATQ